MEPRAPLLLAVLLALCRAQLAAGDGVGAVSEICLGCICEAVSGCNPTLGCQGDGCGLFRITWPYWADSGKPVLQQDNPEDKDAYPRCANDPYCAARAVQGYMRKYAQDCNGDGVIDCQDYAALHRLGGYGCRGGLDAPFRDKFSQCMQHVSTLNGGQAS